VATSFAIRAWITFLVQSLDGSPGHQITNLLLNDLRNFSGRRTEDPRRYRAQETSDVVLLQEK